MPKEITVRGEPILLDQLLYAEYGAVLARDLLPAALDLNPGLAAMGPVIPMGTVVTLPDRPAQTSTALRPVVSLFG
ncbi:tail protein X [Tianweitania sediminis]|uniref:Tail protein X n=1 Tax=Tianweitania sediminis TaxID=1502156 RepID=A0A8J7UGP2_9HYPH|nr:tail protein X [Tianweitania sediminis]MBP0438394.1 tail protein X [Tianweitania sediminis]